MKKRRTLLVIGITGSRTVIELNRQTVEQERIEELIGGEMICYSLSSADGRFRGNVVMIADKDGREKGKPQNRAAMDMYQYGIVNRETIYGEVVLAERVCATSHYRYRGLHEDIAGLCIRLAETVKRIKQ